MKQLLFLFFIFSFFYSRAQDSIFLKVHFLYGSKPLKKYKATEPKWFGGMLGGHVGIEGDSNSIVNFLPSGKFHWFAKKNDKHSMYAIHSEKGFYAIMGGDPDSVKKTIVFVPITAQVKYQFDSIAQSYIKQTPYDYAFMGMRCGAAAYDILSQLGIVERFSYGKTYRRIFYPRRLRKRLLKKAAEKWLDRNKKRRLQQAQMGTGLTQPGKYSMLNVQF